MTLSLGQDYTSKVPDVEMPAFSECFLFPFNIVVIFYYELSNVSGAAKSEWNTNTGPENLAFYEYFFQNFVCGEKIVNNVAT